MKLYKKYLIVGIVTTLILALGFSLAYFAPIIRGGSNTTGMYNSTYNNTMYVGYMYGSTGSLASNRGYTNSAPIKTVTDNWYSKTLNLKTDSKGNTYDSYVSRTAIYCNDRSEDAYVNVEMMRVKICIVQQM